MGIDINQKLVAGDIVSVRAVVHQDAESGEATFVVNDCRFGDGTTRFSREDAVLLSTEICNGDEVRAMWSRDVDATKTYPFGIVRTIIDGKAWVDWTVGESIEPLKDLRRIRTEEQVAAGDLRPGEAPASSLESTLAEMAR